MDCYNCKESKSPKEFKILKAIYEVPIRIFRVPDNWDIDDVEVRGEELWYKGEKVRCPSRFFAGDPVHIYDLMWDDGDFEMELFYDCDGNEIQE